MSRFVNSAKTTLSTTKPRVAISACLCGRNVRYDGDNKLAINNISLELLNKIEWVEICPEVYMGLGVPRPPMNLYKDSIGKYWLKEVDTQKDLTPLAYDKFQELLEGLGHIDAWVLKSKSPSCGYQSTPIYQMNSDNEYVLANGLFVECIFTSINNALVFDEKVFQSLDSYKEFLQKLNNTSQFSN